MDVYGVPGTDDLLDLSNDEIFSATIHSDLHCHASSSAAAASTARCFDAPTANYSDFPDVFCVHSEDVAELEWLSKYMDDSITDFPSNSITSAEAAFCGGSRNIRSRSFTSTNAAASGTTAWSSPSPPNNNVNQRESLINRGKENTEKARRCTHCSTEKTPQWRTGPMGPKTLCNACGVRYKSGRLVPEYRPAASPTFVLTQHSNSHRKVLELRRQKELLRHQQLQSQGCNDITFRFDDVI
ncbi:GATA transcription factor 4-like [Olea europaea var. sylvestris]|uniref:GATA transcription factor 4-like n=1 Tax=Olea europaea var. sylvestris TaxID=158386 RepID=UPI000C1D7422|nr:GATA transcription factor 4-like [Olea europaea var. sylvestris]